MKEEIALKWIAALRSGTFRQGRKQLRCPDGAMCCLGVLKYEVLGDTPDEDRPNAALLDYSDRERSGMISEFGDLPDMGDHPLSGQALSSLNDNGKTFLEIADIIAEHWRDL